MTVDEAIAILDKSATRTTPNAQTAAWEVLRAEVVRLREYEAANTSQDAHACESAEDRFEQYVATLIAKNPDVQKLGERLADWLDEDRFNSVDPILLGIAERLSAAQEQPA